MNSDGSQAAEPDAEARPNSRDEEQGWFNFDFLCENLRETRRQIDEVAIELPGLVNDHIRLLEAGDEDTLEEWRNGPGHHATREARRTAHRIWTDAQADLEDHLYYQNVMHRWQRVGPWRTVNQIAKELEQKVKKSQSSKKSSGKKKKKKGKEKSNSTLWCPHSGNDEKLRRLLDRYDELRYGTAEHRLGLVDTTGGLIEDVHDGTNNLNRVGPRQLHLWTPPYRSSGSGLRHYRFRPEPYELQLDWEAIDKKRREIEEVPDEHDYEPGREPTYRTHEERRRAEREKYFDFAESDAGILEQGAGLRPDGASTRIRDTKDGKLTEDRFRKIQTNQGLFISALESTYDWRTSYDCLDWVKSGFYMAFETSAERGTANHPSQTNQGTKATVTKPTRKRKRAVRKGKSEKESNSVMQEPRKAVTANIQDPDEINEFTGPSKPRKISDIKSAVAQAPSLTTAWAEQTYGRREWHVNMMYSPSSSVHSPPRSPINPDDVNRESIPIGFPDTSVEQIEEAKRRCRDVAKVHEIATEDAEPSEPARSKCARKSERCRAWWPHPPEECWIVQSKEVKRAEPVKHPISEIETPVEFGLPQSGRKIYDNRVIDHYGMMGTGDASWPQIGIRVPYEPMTFDDMKLSNSYEEEMGDEEKATRDGDVEHNAHMPPSEPNEGLGTQNKSQPPGSVSKQRRLYEVHSLAVPIISQSQRPWGNVSNAVDPGMRVDDESDSEGDLFKKSYLGCSIANEQSSEEGDVFVQSYRSGAVTDGNSNLTQQG